MRCEVVVLRKDNQDMFRALRPLHTLLHLLLQWVVQMARPQVLFNALRLPMLIFKRMVTLQEHLRPGLLAPVAEPAALAPVDQ